MKDYVYSASLNMICAVALKHDYELAGTWPGDAVELDPFTALEFMGEAPEDMIMRAGSDGLPAWVDTPPPSPAQLSEQAEQRKTSLLEMAQDTISIWQTKLLLGRISDVDKANLNAWLDYIDVLHAIDTSSIQEIIWPNYPKLI
ncbi:tail fiber assembly protein [Pantoea sp. JK]|uniref:tail fiber assembly protein n=1 Tax=Pantoea sp. JK TaxID=2871703 RepID=UPI0022379B43|nr:tail fiber assembly protein [Pantoea sp. JK]MCW6031620.1 tail fiber assembly protein [Pantoea sp. JK]